MSGPKGFEREPEVSAQIPFAGTNGLDRVSGKRDDGAFVSALLASPAARSLIFFGDIPAFSAASGEPWFHLDAFAPTYSPMDRVLLGVDETGPCFATLFDGSIAQAVGEPGKETLYDRRPRVIPGRSDCRLEDLRSVALQGCLHRRDLAMLSQAKSLLYWHSRHRFCSACGAPSVAQAAGWRRDCPVCSAQHFPRTDPVVIMLATHGDACLMGRQSRFPKGMYSALAGFLEPGETIEEAVRRELYEEAGIATGVVTYCASQPWPFPASLMIGCLAEAKGRALIIDRSELEDARWFSLREICDMLAGVSANGFSAPQPVAIAHHLLKAWVACSLPG